MTDQVGLEEVFDGDDGGGRGKFEFRRGKFESLKGSVRIQAFLVASGFESGVTSSLMFLGGWRMPAYSDPVFANG